MSISSREEYAPPTGVHVAIWMDHRSARIFHVQSDRAGVETIAAPRKGEHQSHPPGAGEPRQRPVDAKRFFEAVRTALNGPEPIFLLGPSSAKFDFLRHVKIHDKGIEARIVCVATVDHPTNPQLVAQARRYFRLKPAHFVK